MKYYPVNMNITGEKVLVVGGGNVAARKIKALVKCGGKVTVVSSTFSSAVAGIKGISLITRRYRKSDIKGARLIISATDSHKTNELVTKHATSANIPVNVVDVPELCTFTLPAQASKGELLITVSTGGGSPALSGRIRKQVEKELLPSFSEHLQILEKIRDRVKQSGLPVRKRMDLLKAMAGEEVGNILRNKGPKEARKLLNNMLADAIKK